ncbi:hypothetical protein Lepto7376_1885 [[Leptolyngbya] sp. PCC 7376]|uniref:vWA domain-containing protein n=1 Tax=[Leptolyngbya] sp. PCC 7376 TaxID=111781 RepID=UPI00029EC85C|nr:vWA domain-containing protein [[Leptolyngbya] sp. PCC 7376]AFY38204.1 hypothetical protein Lepto7376_1885 [[Leptolyngbya] sp. PCC 7376]
MSQGLRYSVDLVICIDATGSMSPVIEEVKASALNFFPRLEAKMAEKDKQIDQTRIRVIVFRDYWADASDKVMISSKFFNLPSESSAFSNFISGIYADGGGDEPENALEALALAMQSPWDTTQGSKQRYVVLVWTDASAHPLEKSPKPSYYPSDIPSTFDDLTDAWDEVDIKSKRLLLFSPDTTPWAEIQDNWENVIHFPSKAGQGLEDYEMDEILEAIANSV